MGEGPMQLLLASGEVENLMNCGVGVDGRITSPGIGPMDSVQVGKAVFVK